MLWLRKKIIPIKRHFASLMFGIVSRLVGSGPPNKYSYEISKPTLIYTVKPPNSGHPK